MQALSTLGLLAGPMLLSNDTDPERGQTGRDILTTCVRNGQNLIIDNH